MTEKQAEYVSDLIQVEMINTTRSIAGAKPGESRKFGDFFAAKLREIAKDADNDGVSAIIEAVQRWAVGPQAVIALVKPTREELAAYLGAN